MKILLEKFTYTEEGWYQETQIRSDDGGIAWGQKGPMTDEKVIGMLVTPEMSAGALSVLGKFIRRHESFEV